MSVNSKNKNYSYNRETPEADNNVSGKDAEIGFAFLQQTI